MNHREYEHRKRALEEQLLADLELIREGHRAKLQALETLWLSSREVSPDADPVTLASVTLASAETQAPPAPEAVPDPSPVPFLQPEPRRGNVQEILATLPDLPEVFDKADVVRLLGYEPHRATLHRAWSQLQIEGRIVRTRASDGRGPTQFRKLPVRS